MERWRVKCQDVCEYAERVRIWDSCSSLVEEDLFLWDVRM